MSVQENSCSNSYRGECRIFDVETPEQRQEMMTYLASQQSSASKPPIIKRFAWSKDPEGGVIVTKLMCILFM